ncbi:MAG: L-threonine 3-dehydrogenase [candidate division Zixibacteria bacterium]|nr:L-threonine 3-dehydrogenase [candidate division Zixibacteria bacterium]
MADKMLAVMKNERAPGAELVTVDIPNIKPDEVLVKVKATSICGTDVHIYNWDEWAASRIKPPMIFGHEFAGEVVQVGDRVKRIQVGDYVSAETHIPCGHCFQCLTGKQHICQNLKILGVDTNGCFAEYVAIPEICAWKNDKSISWEIASVQEPFGNATYTVMESGVSAKIIAILGDGPIACFAAGIAKAVGAARIYGVGEFPYRVNLLKKMGADVALSILTHDTVKEIVDATSGEGVDVVLEMTGVQSAIDNGFKILKKGGTFAAFGIPSSRIELDLANGIIFKGANIIGINGRLMFDTWFQLSNLLKYKKVDISPVITHKLPLKEFHKGMEAVVSSKKEVGKVVFFPEAR